MAPEGIVLDDFAEAELFDVHVDEELNDDVRSLAAGEAGRGYVELHFGDEKGEMVAGRRPASAVFRMAEGSMNIDELWLCELCV